MLPLQHGKITMMMMIYLIRSIGVQPMTTLDKESLFSKAR